MSLETCFLPSLEDDYLKELGAKLKDYGFDTVFAWGHPNGLERGLNPEAFEEMKRLIPKTKPVSYTHLDVYKRQATIKALAAPFPTMRFMPTGGVNADNLEEFLAFDKIIACGGSWMVKDSLIKEGRFDEIERLTREAVEKLK